MRFEKVLAVVSTKRGYTVMLWEEKEEQLTHNRRDLTSEETLEIQKRCKRLSDLCGK